MTYETALKHSGINFQTVGVDEFTGTTKSGKTFYLRSSAGAWGEWTLDISGMNTTAHCLWRTAIKKIKSN